MKLKTELTCSLVKDHEGDHHAYRDHDVNREVLHVWPSRRSPSPGFVPQDEWEEDEFGNGLGLEDMHVRYDSRNVAENESRRCGKRLGVN